MRASQARLIVKVLMGLQLASASAFAFAATPSLQVTPAISRADQAITIRVVGLAPGAAATISATTRDIFGNHWRSRATCVADRTGVIDLDQCVPVAPPGAPASTYSKRDGMGLFWSMHQLDGASTLFWFPRSPSAVYELALTVDGKLVERMPIERQLMADGVTRIPLTPSDDGISGVAFEPSIASIPKSTQSHDPAQIKTASSHGKRFPAVILVSGSGGGHQLDLLAELLAAHGYETLSLAYYTGYSDSEDLPADLLDIPVETVGKGLAWLKKQTDVNPDEIAVLGHSRGSELALLGAAAFPAIRAAVVLAGSPVAWPGINPHDVTRDYPAWTLHGQPVPYLHSVAYFARAYKEHKPPITAFEQALDNTAAREAAFIPIQRIHGPILFLFGNADALWPSTRMAEMAMAYLRAQHHPYKDRMESFPDAGHFCFEPYIPVENRVTWSTYDEKFGGTAAGDARAAPEAWARILKFLHTAFTAPTS